MGEGQGPAVGGEHRSDVERGLRAGHHEAATARKRLHHDTPAALAQLSERKPLAIRRPGW